jgi:hypothetical protein
MYIQCGPSMTFWKIDVLLAERIKMAVLFLIFLDQICPKVIGSSVGQISKKYFAVVIYGLKSLMC